MLVAKSLRSWLLSENQSWHASCNVHGGLERRVLPISSKGKTLSKSTLWIQSEQTRRFAMFLLVAIVILARLWRVRFGLPDFLEEAIPFRLAIQMKDVTTGHIDWNPHDFNYPSLSIYAHFAVQQCVFAVGRLFGTYRTYADYILAYYVDPTPMVVPARLVGIACDALSVVGVVRLGERLERGAGLIGGLVVALSPILITTSRSIFCDSVMAVFAIWGIERMIAWRDAGRRRDLVAAVVFVGLATGSKYPAVALLLPLTYLIWDRYRSNCLPTLAAVVGLVGIVFVATTPFAIFDMRTLARDLLVRMDDAAGGHMGSVGHRSLLFHLHNLVDNVGWAGSALLIISPALVLKGVECRRAIVTLWLALLGFGLPISMARIDAERYLAPVILIAAVLAGLSASLLFDLVPRHRRSWALGVGALALLPVAVSGYAVASRGADTTQLQARRWCEANVGTKELLVQEGYGARLPTDRQVAAVKAELAYRLASAGARSRIDAVRPFHVVAIPLYVSGRIAVTVPYAGKPATVVPVFEHTSQLTAVFYDPRLFSDVDYFMTSAAVRSRYEADPRRYPIECAFYAFLNAHSQVVARFGPQGTVVGPEIIVYRVGQDYRDALAPEPSIRPLWWTAVIPHDAQDRLKHALGAQTNDTTDAGPAWIASLAPLYADKIEGFVLEMANEFVVLGRNVPARTFSGATLAVRPDDIEACTIFSVSSGRMDRWQDAQRATERAMVGANEIEPALILLHARALQHTGNSAGAIRELDELLSRVDAAGPVGKEAHRMIDQMRSRRS